MPSLAATAGHRARSVASALRLAVIAWLAVVATALPAGSPGYKPGVVLVQFKPAPAAQAMAAAQLSSPLQGVSLQRLVGQLHTLSIVRPTPGVASTAAAGGSVDGTAGSSAGPRLVSVDGVSYSSVPPEALMLMAITDGTSPVDKAAQLSQMAEVEYAEPVYYRKLSAVPNDPFYPAKATTSGLWFLDRIAAPAAWDITTGSSSVPVCVIDTGARRTHQDLAANIKGGWNRGEDANGNLPKPGSPAYYNFSDDAGHGTHTTGSVGAVGNNGLGGTGVAWQAALWHCKVGSVPDSNGDVWLSTDGIIDCYSLCASKGAKVVSASYGGPDFMMSEMTAIDAIATTSGGLLFAAAGNEAVDNDKVPSYPASYVTPSNNVISVAASLASDELAAFSNWGRITVHIATPGINIRSTVPASDSSYGYSTGTSMATPITAGAAALLFAANPNASWADVRAALLGSVDQVPALAGKVTSGGRLNVQRALATLLGLPLPNAAPNYIFSVATGIQYNLLLGPFEKQQTLTTPAAANCMASCRTTPWCWFATHSGTTCQLVDASVLLDSAVPMPGATSGYKLPVTSSPGGTRTPPGGSTPLGIRLPPPARSPPARPPPARPPPPRLQQPRPPPPCPPPPRPSPPPPRPSPLPPKRQPPSAQGRAPARPVASPPPRGGGQHLSDRRSLKGAQRRQQRGNPVW